MVKGFFSWLEYVFGLAGYFLLWLLGAAWVLLAGVYWLENRALVYAFWPMPSGEAVPVIATIVVLLWSALYCTVKAAVSGERDQAAFLSLVAPKVFWISLVALAAWWVSGPVAAASRVLPIGLVTVSAWCWYVSHWGFLSGQKTKVRQGAVDEGGEAEAPARVSRPKTTFASIYGNEAIKARLKDAASAITVARKDDKRPRNGILLHGGPGNGKTVFAEALAGQLGLPLVTLTYADIASQWVGEKSARVRAAFEQAKRQQPCVLFVDEVDSFLQDRTRAQRSWEVTAVNEMLTQMETFSGVFIASTNLMDGLDQAALRRFDLKVKFGYLRPAQAWDLFEVHCESLGLPAPDASACTSVGRLATLTPGDFAAVARQHRPRLHRP